VRTLKFIVDGQIIRPDPNCDFDNLVPGTSGYLQAEFSFSPEWNGFVKIIAFYSSLGREYPPQLLKDGKTCFIPSEALKKRSFKLCAIGSGFKKTLKTNKVVINQNGGK
jgi:hypothetical protein